MVADLAGQGKVRVRRVALIRSRIANAYASVGGTVGLTTSLVRQLEPDEVRAVIAHELGHLKLRHPQRTLAISLGVSAVTLGIWFGLQALVGKHPSMEVRMLLNTPMVFMFAAPILRMLLMGKGMREREEQADRLAVEWTGDPELVIRAMERIHHLNQSPGRLKPSDEALSTHPSLAHRIEAIRRIPAS